MIKLTQKNFALKKILKFINTVLSQVKKIRNYIYYNSLNFSHLGENISFGKNLDVYGPKYISIGDNTYVGDYSIINAGKGGKIKIGKNCSVAANVKLINWYHDLKKMDISLLLISLAGTPPIIEKSSKLEFTRLLGNTTQPLPRLTPLVIVTLYPSQQSSLILMSLTILICLN